MASRAVTQPALGKLVVPHAPPPCGFLKLTQPPPWEAGPFSRLLDQLTVQILAITGKLMPFHNCSLHIFPSLASKEEVFKFIFRDLPNTECMFHLSKLAPSYEQTLGLEERKNEDITPPRGKMETREETKTAALQVMVGYTVRFPQTPCHPFLWTIGVHMGF